MTSFDAGVVRLPPPAKIGPAQTEGPLQCGCVLFDDGASGPGWACEADAPRARRINGLGDLGLSRLWLTNIESDDFYQSGLNSNAWLRNGDYLRLKIMDILDEWGGDPARPDLAVVLLSTLFQRVIGRTQKALSFGGRVMPINGAALTHDLARLFTPPDDADEFMASAVRESLQYFTRTSINGGRDSKTVNLRLPRQTHAAKMLATIVPLGRWDFIAERKMPEKDRVAWLQNLGRPFIARVQVRQMDRSYAEVFAFGSGAREEDGSAMRRSWATDPEITVLSQMADLQIQGAWVAASGGDCRTPEVVEALRSVQHPLAMGSWSSGMVAENLWLAGTRPGPLDKSKQKKRGKGEKSPRQMVPRAAFLRSADRLATFFAAQSLYSEGYKVISYGTGGVRVAVAEDEISNLISCAFRFGLLAPLSVTAVTPVTVRLADWGGEKAAAVQAVLRAGGHREALLRLDALPDMSVPAAVQEAQSIMSSFVS